MVFMVGAIVGLAVSLFLSEIGSIILTGGGLTIAVRGLRRSHRHYSRSQSNGNQRRRRHDGSLPPTDHPPAPCILAHNS